MTKVNQLVFIVDEMFKLVFDVTEMENDWKINSLQFTQGSSVSSYSAIVEI